MAKTRFALAALGLGVGLWLAAAPAFADLAPEPGDPEEAACSVESEQAKGRTECTECATYHAEPKKCAALADDGYTQSCRSSGASVWHEVWCKGTAAAPPAEPKTSGCGSCSTQGSGAPTGTGAALGAGLLLLWNRRRAKRA